MHVFRDDFYRPSVEKRGRVYLRGGSCVRLVPYYRNHVWSYDFVLDRLAIRKLIRPLTVIDESAHECLAICVGFRLSSEDAMDVLERVVCARRFAEAHPFGQWQ